MDVPITAKAALLQVLLEGPAYGRTLYHRIYDRTNGKVDYSQGSLYPALKKMVADGTVTAEDVVVEGQGPRQVFKLTPKGTSVAEQQRMWLLGLTGAVRA